jgi:hypothetical protein
VEGSEGGGEREREEEGKVCMHVKLGSEIEKKQENPNQHERREDVKSLSFFFKTCVYSACVCFLVVGVEPQQK